ncbi:MAG: urease accessory protein UreE, partial [Synechococcaceae cyanobacterium SM2_3_60]|nr:urease accessory protein UreE [Synechococcaceae cyanobacterium SM2_3_60]
MQAKLLEAPPMLVLSQLSLDTDSPIALSLRLTAAERQQVRRIHTTCEGLEVKLALPRGGRLRPGAVLTDTALTTRVLVQAKPEPVLTVRAASPLDLADNGLPLGNRHVPVQLTTEWLRLAPDAVLEHLLQ